LIHMGQNHRIFTHGRLNCHKIRNK